MVVVVVEAVVVEELLPPKNQTILGKLLKEELVISNNFQSY